MDILIVLCSMEARDVAEEPTIWFITSRMALRLISSRTILSGSIFPAAAHEQIRDEGNIIFLEQQQIMSAKALRILHLHHHQWGADAPPPGSHGYGETKMGS